MVLFVVIPKGFIPDQDTDQIAVITEAAQGTSYYQDGRVSKRRGERRPERPCAILLILPSIGAKPDEPVDQVLLRFAQTTDREFVVENDGGQLIGTLALLDLVLMQR